MTQRSKRKKRNKKYKDLPQGIDAVISKDDKDASFIRRYNITPEPIKYIVNKIPEEFKNQQSDLKIQIYKEPKEAIPKLLILKAKYPDTPILYNYLSVAYSQLGDLSAMNEISIENYTKNPDYLFAKTNYAHICLDQGEYEKIPEIFDNKFDLKLIYPDRDEFHISEFEALTGMMCIYYHYIGENDAAMFSYNALKTVSPDSSIFAHVHKLLYPGKIARIIPKRRNKKADNELQA